MGITTATVSVLLSSLLGAGLRLLLYPQFLCGGGLIFLSILLKLSKNIVGVAIVLGVLASLLLVLILFNDSIIRSIKRFSPTLGRNLLYAATSISTKLTEATLVTVQQFPSWAPTLLVVIIPFLGQLAGSLSTMRMLSKVDVKAPEMPGLAYSTVFSVLYLATLSLGVSKSWLKPQRVSFIIQSFWVLSALLSPKTASSIEFRDNLPSVLAGWGGFILGFLPANAVLKAVQAGAITGAITAGAAVTFEGMNTANKLRTGEYSLEGMSERLSKLTPSLEDVNDMWSYYTSEEFLSERLETVTNLLSSIRAEDLWNVLVVRVKSNMELTKTYNLKLGKSRRKSSHVVDENENDKAESLHNETDPANTDETDNRLDEAAEVSIEDKKTIFQSLDDAGLNLQSLSPPMHVALLITILSMIPTCLVLTSNIFSILLNLGAGNFRPAMLIVPAMLSPYALGEAIAVTRFIGFKRGLTPRTVVNSFADQYEDGMALILNDSPKALSLWRKIAFLDSTVRDANFDTDELVETLVEAPRQFFDPDENTIANAPEFSNWVVGKLGEYVNLCYQIPSYNVLSTLCVTVASIVIDFIGVLSVGIPILGDLIDFAWAPISGMLIHQMYGVRLLSWIGVIEEILPFTDIIPTATIAWLYTYGQHMPVWMIRGSRKFRHGIPANPFADVNLDFFQAAKQKLF